MSSTEKEQQADYKNRMNRVLEYIDQHLEADLSLNTISKIACFSPFHFHRIFKFITNETLNDYITRRKIEKSALDLLHKNTKTTEIAHNYGFSDGSSFSKTFKKYYGINPTEFRKQNPHRIGRIRQLKSKNGQEYPDKDTYICRMEHLKQWIQMHAEIKIKEMPTMKLAYVSSIGTQNLANAYQKLIQWATPKGLMHAQAKIVTIYHDSFKVTQANKVRMSASIILNKPAETDGAIGQTSIAEGKFIVGSFEIEMHEFETAWTGLFLWMNEHGYKKADREPFEIHHNNYHEHPEKKAMVDLCIPIE